MRGCFITMEGPDGSGKTTQIRKLADALTAMGLQVMTTREPGGTRISDRVRELLLDPDHTEMTEQAEILLYAASRAQHVHERILPALAEGKIVLCDRFVDASLAYQAYALGRDPDVVRMINHFATSSLTPHRTYLLDVPIEVGLRRIRERAASSGAGLDRIERRGPDYHRLVREGFARIAEAEPDRIRRIAADRDPDAVAEDIREDCKRLLAQLGFLPR